MRRIHYYQYGGPEVMRLEQFEPETPRSGQVSIRVHYAAINPIDWKLRAGEMKFITGNRFPRAMGMDLSGTVLSIGPGVTRFKVGDEVFGQTPFRQCGALGDVAIANEAALALKPANLGFDQAACLGTAGVTAWNALIDKARLRAGQHILINGCMGAVGEAAVQIARNLGAHVTGVCSESDIARARALGVVRAYDYRSTDLTLLDECYDAVLDTSSTMDNSTGFRLLKPGGRLLDLYPSPFKFLRAMFDRRFKLVMCSPTPDILMRLGDDAAEGRLCLSIAEQVSLEAAVELIGAVEQGRRLGGKALVFMGGQ